MLLSQFAKPGDYISYRDLNRKFGRAQKYAGELDRALNQLVAEERLKLPHGLCAVARWLCAARMMYLYCVQLAKLIRGYNTLNLPYPHPPLPT
jgi:hypothetical protein